MTFILEHTTNPSGSNRTVCGVASIEGLRAFANPDRSIKVNTNDITDRAITADLIQESDGGSPTQGIQRSNLTYHLQNAIMTIRHRNDAFTFPASGLILETNDDETIIYGLFLADATIHHAIAANVAIEENSNIRRVRMTSDPLDFSGLP